jgi:hypothetical protein
MKTIRIGCSRNNKVGSKLIRWWIGAEYSHVYAVWHLSDQEREIVYQASHGSVNMISHPNFVKNNDVVKEFELELSCKQFKKFSQKCIDLAGEPYSKLQLLQIFLSDVSGGRLQFKDQRGYICSELMAEMLEDFFGAKFEKPRHMITPRDIVDYLVNNKSL